MINELLKSLSKRKSSDIVYNQYQNEDVLNNLKLYFEYLLANKPCAMLVGEAPGHRGCKITGIPFTSGAIINKAEHKMFKEIGAKITFSQVVKEQTATMFWDFFGEEKQVPIIWNAFPFHPHNKNSHDSNRHPNESEIAEGESYLKNVYNIFKPKVLVGVGLFGKGILLKLFPDKKVVYVRHPANGGKKAFIKGIQEIIK